MSNSELAYTFLTTSYPRSLGDDAAIFVARMVEAVTAKGAKANVVVPLDADEALLEDRNGVRIHRFKYGIFSKGRLCFGAGIFPNIKAHPYLMLQAPWLVLGFALTLWNLRNGTKIVVANWLPSACAAFLISFFAKLDYAIVLRGEDVKLLKLWPTRLLLLPVLCRAKKLITVSQHFAEYFNKDLNIKARCIHNGVNSVTVSEQDRSQVENEYQLSKRKKLLIVGRVIPLKRIEIAIDLLAQPQLAEFELLVAGRDQSQEYLETLKKRAASRGVADRVKFLGLVPPQKIPSLLALSTFFVSASEYEGRPNSVLEAMAQGCVVVLSDITAHREALGNSDKTGILLHPDKLPELADTLKKLADDRSLYQSLAKNAFDQVTPYSWSDCASRYLEELNSEA